MSFDEEALTTLLVQAARAAFTAAKAAHPDETFYAYALYTTPEFQFISPLVCGEQGLRRVAEQYDANNVEAEMKSLRWSPADSPYLEEGEEHFEEVAAFMGELPPIYELPESAFTERVARVEACCIAALKQLDSEGLFGEGPARDAVTVNVLQGDQSNRSRLDNARELNPEAVWQRMAEAMAVTQEVGTFTALGPPAYQMADLAVCGVLMATGGGRDVYLFEGDRQLFRVALDGTVTETGLRTKTRSARLRCAPTTGFSSRPTRRASSSPRRTTPSAGASPG